jgi:predicted phosphate transport protein (TIGR00153 family)
MISLFGKTNELINKIDSFIDLITEASLHFKAAIQYYIDNRVAEFNERYAIIVDYENKADALRIDVESQLYSQTLIPESRGDVLGILESMDTVIDWSKSTIQNFSIEKPVIPENLRQKFLELTESVVKAVEALSHSTRAYFYNINAVKDHLHIVKYYEKESDKNSEKIKREIFSMDIDLGQKIQLSYFIRHIDSMADMAEDIANRLSIATIKRIV